MAKEWPYPNAAAMPSGQAAYLAGPVAIWKTTRARGSQHDQCEATPRRSLAAMALRHAGERVMTRREAGLDVAAR